MNNTLLILLFILLNLCGYSQDLLTDTIKYSLEINVLDKNSQKEIKNAEIKILNNDSIIIIQNRNDSMPFHIKLDYNKHYTLLIKTKGYNNITLKVNHRYAGKPKRFIESVNLSPLCIDYPDYTFLKFTLNNFKLNQIIENKLDSLILDLNQIKSIKSLEITSYYSPSERKKIGIKRVKEVKKYLVQNGLTSIKLVTKTHPKSAKMRNKKEESYVSFSVLSFNNKMTNSDSIYK